MDNFMGKLVQVHASPYFKGIPAQVLQDVARIAQRRSLSKGEALYWQGETAHTLYLVSQGEIALKQDHTVVRVVEAGGYCGAYAMLSGGAYPFSAIAHTDCLVLAVPSAPIQKLLLQFPLLLVRTIAPTVLWLSEPSAASTQEMNSHLTRREDVSCADLGIDPLTLLRQCDALVNVPMDDLVALSAQCRVQQVSLGETVMQQGLKLDTIFFVASGAFEGRSDNVVVHTTPVANFLGVFSLIYDLPLFASAVATMPSTLLCLDTVAFKKFLREHPEVIELLPFNQMLAKNPFLIPEILWTFMERFTQENNERSQQQRAVNYTERRKGIHERESEYSLDALNALLFERVGHVNDANMTVLDLLLTTQPQIPYVIDADGPKEVAGMSVDLGASVLEEWPTSSSEPPTALLIEGTWDRRCRSDGSGNNILGENGSLLINPSQLTIPVVAATAENLAYYGAKLLPIGSCVQFPLTWPIWTMLIGENYLRDFILTPAGGGLYVEYHNDKPHFHMPVNHTSKGYYLLGKDLDPGKPSGEKHRYAFTAFSIPIGSAVYTCGGAIHCDSGLIGPWMVGYANAEDFSTVIFTTENSNAIVDIQFMQPDAVSH